MNVLALDPSSKSIGWAVHDVNTGITSGAWRPLSWRSAQQTEFGRHLEMCGRSGAWLADMITEHAPEVVAIETAVPIRYSRCLERLAGALMLVLYTREVLAHPVTPNTWQAWANQNCQTRLTQWRTDDKPDDIAAELILEWFMSTTAHRVVAA